MVESVSPYEEAKIRILNASHSCIAWAGTLIGLQFIHEGTHDAAIRGMAYDYVTDDVIPCLNAARPAEPGRPAGLPRRGARPLRQPAIRDTNQRVAMDGFSKIPGFIAPTVRERLARGGASTAWRCCRRCSWPSCSAGTRARCPMPTRTRAWTRRAHAICEAADPLAAFVADASLWGELAGSRALREAIAAARIDLHGILGDSAMS